MYELRRLRSRKVDLVKKGLIEDYHHKEVAK